MTYLKFILSFLLICLCGITWNPILAQEHLYSDESWIYPRIQVGSTAANKKSGTPPPDTLSLPLFDDFSYDSLFVGLSGIWDINPLSDRRPTVSIGKGMHPPSKGVAIFDGATRLGKLFKNVLETGWADSLVSNPVNLASKTTGDSIYLSFFIEPGGLGDRPEPTDSFCVYFDTSGDYGWKLVCVIYGDSFIKNDSIPGIALSSDRFQPVLLPLDTSTYFHDAFRFKFAAFGSLNGEMDVWNLDYVYFDEGRTQGDSLTEDLSITYQHTTIFGNYSAVPQNSYNSSGLMSGTWIETHNSGGTNRTRNSNSFLVSPDPVGGNVFSGITGHPNAITVDADSFSLDSVLPFDAQTFTQAGVFAVESWLDTDAADLHPENDTIKVEFRVDSVYAYDDGIGDGAYGLTSAKGFCQRFTLPDTVYDTLEAVWIHFSPTLYYNGTTQQSTTMEGKSFKCGVWNDSANFPDTLIKIYLAAMTIGFGNQSNDFVRYALSPAIRVPSNFYIGIVQNNSEPVGIGVDHNFDASDQIYYQDQFFDWQNTTQLQGSSLMIRPEFKHSSTFVSRESGKKAPSNKLVIYPNPSTDGSFDVAFGESGENEGMTLQVLDMQGIIVYVASCSECSGKLHIDLPSGVESGLYIIEVKTQNDSGSEGPIRRKMLVQR